jgi:hypothetical protein
VLAARHSGQARTRRNRFYKLVPAGVSLDLLCGLFRIFGGHIEKRRRPARAPIAVLSLLGSIGLFALAQTEILARLGNLTVWPFDLFLTG